MGQDQIFQTVMFEFIQGVGFSPAAIQQLAQAGIGLNLDQDTFVILGMCEQSIDGIGLEM